ncbi:Adaptin N terminal region family protein [Tritrichomonas foetus]|uniref:Adaptin N terminal region family protein n=1 Tax=Tritrichomonas foetus TaxID=1144522 RepID=A0A1J4JTL8_9EUKA|nr:Adaptin N terminal region family protein [Tritrichomonas foetus]|eukprot:OHT02090.1 Adaptin N terminal region family protein [Tritrichomonas foetus]
MTAANSSLFYNMAPISFVPGYIPTTVIPKKKPSDRFHARTEIPKLRDKLDSNSKYERKEAATRVCAIMRQGENVLPLFSNMLRCVKTDDIQLKKLAYLYLIKYSSQEPEQAIMAVNTFIQDSQDANPIVRALAVRTMCRIRLQSVAENMIIPLKRAMKDESPYVRKTAAFGVSKLYDILPDAVENAGLFDQLLSLLRDENPMVVSNTIAAIFEINQTRSKPILTLTAETVIPILSALNDCTEWCQTMILDALSQYVPESTDHAESLIDRLVPFLKNANPAVVIGAFKCIYIFMEYDERGPPAILPEIIPPFMTLLLSAEHEIQYVVLRTLSLFVLRYPKALSHEITVFFCKYNDPAYIKMEKLEIMMSICSRSNAKVVLDELGEYCNAVDVAFVKKAIHCIGQIALKFEATAPACVDVLMKLLQGKADYAVEESVIVICDILRRFPQRYDKVIEQVCKVLEQIKEPASRAAAIWILGEYSDTIENIDILLDPFLDTFHDEDQAVQIQLITSLVKCFINKPDKSTDQLQFILNEASKESVAPDVRNQALIYYRLLRQDVSLAKDVVIFGKESVEHSGIKFDESILEELLRNMGSLSGVLHEVPSIFVKRLRISGDDAEDSRVWQQLTLQDDVDFIDVFFDCDGNKFYLRIVNRSASPISDFAFVVNKNMLGLSFGEDSGFPDVLEEDQSCDVEFELIVDSRAAVQSGKQEFEYALRTNYGTVFANGRIPIEAAFLEEGQITQEQFTVYYNQFETEFQTTLEYADIADDAILNARKVYVIGHNGGKTFVSFLLPGKLRFIGDLEQDGTNVYLNGLTNAPILQPLIIQSAKLLFTGSRK